MMLVVTAIKRHVLRKSFIRFALLALLNGWAIGGDRLMMLDRFLSFVFGAEFNTNMLVEFSVRIDDTPFCIHNCKAGELLALPINQPFSFRNITSDDR
jgi:hypothetical protein